LFIRGGRGTDLGASGGRGKMGGKNMTFKSACLRGTIVEEPFTAPI